MPPRITGFQGPLPFGTSESALELWRRVGAYAPDEVDRALAEMMEGIRKAIDADNVVWIGAVRVQTGARAKRDPFFGWRLRTRVPLRNEPVGYQQALAGYYTTEHYGKLSASYFERSHADKEVGHIGMTGRASFVGAGAFRVHRLRDRDWIDFEAFKRTLHYALYYKGPGIIDRMTIGFPVHADGESFFLIDRYQRHLGPKRLAFSNRNAAVAGMLAKGVPDLHRRLFLSSGLMAGNKPLGPIEREILHHLLTDRSEKEIAEALGQKTGTLHKYVTQLYQRYRVRSRAGLMRLWLKPF